MSNQNQTFASFSITQQLAAEMISDHIYEAYNEHGDNDPMVAAQILYLYDMENSTAHSVPSNLEIVEQILFDAGGARSHQCKFSFRMGVK